MELWNYPLGEKFIKFSPEKDMFGQLRTHHEPPPLHPIDPSLTQKKNIRGSLSRHQIGEHNNLSTFPTEKVIMISFFCLRPIDPSITQNRNIRRFFESTSNRGTQQSVTYCWHEQVLFVQVSMFFCFFEQTTSSAREWGVRVVRICRNETGIANFNLKNGFEIDWGRRSAKFRLQIHAHSNHAQQEEVNCNIIWLVNSESPVLIQLYLPFCCFIIFYNLSHGPTAPPKMPPPHFIQPPSIQLPS